MRVEITRELVEAKLEREEVHLLRRMILTPPSPRGRASDPHVLKFS